MVSKYTSYWHKQASFAMGLFVAAPLVLSVGVAPVQAHGTHGDDTEYYIGLDGSQLLIRGTYTGLNNPNYQRLTFLYAHREDNPESNHFHGIGAYSYLGDRTNPTVTATNTNNRIPEISTGIPPLKLLPGTGIHTDRLISFDTHEEYSNLNIKAVRSLAGATQPDDLYLFNSSDGRWQSSLAGATIGLQLLEISSGLNIANESGDNILQSIGDIYTIGNGDDFSFIPTFWTSKTATPGKYSAKFKLVDLSNNYLESGTFSLDFQVEKVPEPSTTIALGLVGLLTFSLSQLKKLTASIRN